MADRADRADAVGGLDRRESSASRQLVVALEELAAARALTREVQRIAGIGTFVFDITTGAALWSAELRRIFGIEKEERTTLDLERFLKLLHPEDYDRVVAHFQEKTQLGDRAHSIHRIITPAGESRCVDVHGEVVQLSDKGGLTLVGTVQDITERRKAEEEIALKSAQVRLMETKLAFLTRQSAMGTMAATLAHELNQPLTAISNYSSGMVRLADEAQVSELILEGLRSIQESALRAGEIIRRMRTIGQEGQVRRERVNLFDVAADAIRFTGEACHGVNFQYRFEHSSDLLADRVQIEQVMVNLIKNACEAVEGREERVITIGTLEDAEGVIVSVADTGPGLPARTKLFEATTSSKSGGMGIGLSICRTIVEAHGGQIWAEPQAAGTCICFKLPKGP